MSQTSTHLNLPYIQPAQAQKHVTHNEAIELLDLITQLTVIGFDDQIASWRAGGWLFVPPVAGWRAYGADEIRVFDGSAWVAIPPVLENLPGVGINATSDATNKLSVAADATLLNHAGSGHQLKLNKSATGDTAALLFQSNWSGRAEMGLAGTDDFAVKVSDGATWFTGLTVVGASGAVQINEVLSLPPRATPAPATAGDVYFDSTSNKLRCYDGTLWQDLF